MRHTIDDAASLVGRTRRSLYRAMTEGRIAYGLKADGRRYIDTTELLRVYGAFDPPSQSVIPKMSHGVIVPDDLGEIIAKAVAKAVAEAVEPLRQEIEKLRLENTEQRLIEHKPSIPPVGDHPQFDGAAKDKPQSFADLLAGMD
ncbi:Uncharacterised protein [Pseudomonas fragi]|uniref:DNA-binding protein n=2 Tax=Pseudomonas fragi TaxID=296 RepID=A0A449IML2_PSEFR|nr:Uncharacterised protein [Pseudomonas fragi]